VRRFKGLSDEMGGARRQARHFRVLFVLTNASRKYVEACAAKSIAPLPQAELRALIETLVERADVIVQ
jgi:hypothetical protein